MATLTIEDVKAKIRAVPNFPKEGIVFRDITTGLKDAQTNNERDGRLLVCAI